MHEINIAEEEEPGDKDSKVHTPLKSFVPPTLISYVAYIELQMRVQNGLS